MNERIKELWDKAATASAAYPSGQYTSWETQVNFMDKFAELIVRECAQVCSNIDAEYEGGDVLATWCATAIKEHFGVEE